MKPRILAVGSSNIDFVCRMDKVPEGGQTITSNDTYAFVPGGKGANTAVAAARLGADVVFCTKLGNDSYGSQLSEKYKNEGIDTRFVLFDKENQTGLAVVMVEGTGQNRIVVYPGANARLTNSDIEDAFTCCPDALLIQCEIENESVYYAIDEANRQGAKVFLDAGPAKADFDLSRLGKLCVFSPNESETLFFTGINPNSADNCLRAAVAICQMVDTEYVVLKLGNRGCFVYDGLHYQHIAPVELGKAVDTTAAGDSFTAALTHKFLINGGDIYDAALYANAVGAYVVTKHGAFSSLPTQAQLDEALRMAQEQE